MHIDCDNMHLFFELFIKYKIVILEYYNIVILLLNPAEKKRREEVINWIRNVSYIDREEVINPGKVCVKNGVIDFTTGKLYYHNPSMIFITQIPVEYNPTTTCPQIEKFLHEVLDESDVLAILEFFGYCLTSDTSIQKAFMLYGKGGEGKSTLLSLLTTFVGKDNVAGESLQKLENDRVAVANLHGKTVNIFPDLPDHAVSDNSMFKQLTGGDRLRGERKFGQPFYFKNSSKLIFSANSLPKVHNGDFAYFRRWVLIRFSKQVPSDRIDPNLIDKLTTPEELSGLLNLAITGLKRLMKKGGYTYNKSTEEVEREYKIKSDPVAAFVDECVQFSATEQVSKAQMFSAYCDWCKKHGIEFMREQGFSRALTAIGFSDERETSGNRERYWKDCSLKQSVQLTQNELDDKNRYTKTSSSNCPTQNDNFVEFSVEQSMCDCSISKQNREMSWRVGRIEKNQVQEPVCMSSNSNPTSWTDSKEEHIALEEEIIKRCNSWASQNGPILHKNVDRAIMDIGKNLKMPFDDIKILIEKYAERLSFDNKYCIDCGDSYAPNKSISLIDGAVYRCDECYHQYSNRPTLCFQRITPDTDSNNSIHCMAV